MNNNPLGLLLKLLEQVPAEARSQSFMTIVEGDALSAEKGFPACVVAPDSSTVDAVAKEVPEAIQLPPYRGSTRWEAEQRLALERAGVVIAFSSVSQLLPRQVFEALGIAADAGTPIALIVGGFDRVSNPEVAASGVASQLSIALPQMDIHPIFLGGRRYCGSSLPEALSASFFKIRPEAKARALASARIKAALILLGKQATVVDNNLRDFQENKRILLGEEEGERVMARARFGAVSRAFSRFVATIATLDAGAVVEEAWVGDSEESLTRRVLGLLSQRAVEVCERSLYNAESEAHAGLVEIGEILNARIGRSKEGLVEGDEYSTLSPIDTVVLSEQAKRGLEDTSAAFLAELKKPSQALLLMQLLGEWRQEVDSKESESKDNVGESTVSAEDETSSEPHEGEEEGESQTAEEQEPSRFKRHGLAFLKLGIKKKVVSELEEMIMEAHQCAAYASDSAVAILDAAVDKLVEQAFGPLQETASCALKGALAKQAVLMDLIDSLNDFEDSLEEEGR